MASVELRAAAVQYMDEYRKQPTPRRVTLRNIQAGEERFVDYGTKCWLEWSSITDRCKNKIGEKPRSLAA